MAFTYASLFAGIGGFETALNRLGGRCVFASEIDKHARKAYEVLYGGDVLHGDITKIDAKDVPDHDLLTAGFPCQAFSVAGKRKGFDDTRGTLFFEIARIAKEKRPKALLLENVKGLVGHDKGRTLDTIVKTLNEIGYTIDFEVLNSKYFGVPQNRERIFIVAIRDDLVVPEPWQIEGNTVVPKGKRRLSGYDWLKSFNFDWPAQVEVTTRLRDVLETDVDERFYLSDEKTARLVEQLNRKDNEDNTKVYGSLEYYRNDQMNRVYSTEGVSPTITVVSGGGREQKIAELKEVANGTDLSYCLDANYTKGIAPSGVGKGRRTHVVETKPRYRIRKLTPRECWGLQGFSDVQHDAVEDAGVSNSQRYKQAGNAVTVNVVEALGSKLLAYLTKECEGEAV